MRKLIGKLSTRKILDFAHQIALGLAAAHGKKIVHRDLKPENVFVTDAGQVKVSTSAWPSCPVGRSLYLVNGLW